MDAATLTFGIKDVVAIVVGVITIVSFIYALVKSSDKNQTLALQALSEIADHKKITEEKFLHAKNAKKANIDMIFDEINKAKDELDKKETSIYTKISEVKLDQKEAHDKLSTQINAMSTQLTLIGNGMSELTGYIKAKKEEK